MNMREKDLVQQAMISLEFLPAGGVGKDGFTQFQIDEANEDEVYVGKDANVHLVQSAWLKLREAMK